MLFRKPCNLRDIGRIGPLGHGKSWFIASRNPIASARRHPLAASPSSLVLIDRGPSGVQTVAMAQQYLGSR